MPIDIPDPDDVDSVDDLLAVIQNLATEVERIDGNVNGFHERLSRLATDIDDNAERIDGIQEDVQLVDASVPEQSKSKLDNLKNVLQYATTDATGGMSGVAMETGEVTACIDGSRDTALRLMDEMAATFTWAEVQKPGGPQANTLRLKIDGKDRQDLISDVAREYATG